jgi:hypothetical protein
LSVQGKIIGRWRRGFTPVLEYSKTDYRLMADLISHFGETANLKMSLDTMDSGFGGTTRDLMREMIAVEGKVKIGKFNLQGTVGPGDVNHIDDGLFPGENGMKYRRPWRTIGLSTVIERTGFGLEYLARSTTASGLIDVGETSLKISQDFDLFKITLTPRYFTGLNGGRDLRLDLLGEYKPSKELYSSILVGLAKTIDYPHGLYVKGELWVNNELKIIAQKVGSQYREQYSYTIFDTFDRGLVDGTTNYGVEYKKDFYETWFGRVKGDYTNPGEILTTEFGLGKQINPDSTLELIYQTYQNTEAVGLTASFKF